MSGSVGLPVRSKEAIGKVAGCFDIARRAGGPESCFAIAGDEVRVAFSEGTASTLRLHTAGIGTGGGQILEGWIGGRREVGPGVKKGEGPGQSDLVVLEAGEEREMSWTESV